MRFLRSLAILIGVAWAVPASAQSRSIDTAKSTMIVHVFKSGALSMFGHNHEISAPIHSGSADITAKHVELTVETTAMRVLDPGVSEKDRSEIQSNMLGPQVLDTARFKEIVFRSTSVEPAGPGAWTVIGSLSLHGETKPVTVRIAEKDGHYTGQAQLKLTSFGITPIKVAGGAVKVKNEIRIEFDIQLAR